jgi:hypothetical protein
LLAELYRTKPMVVVAPRWRDEIKLLNSIAILELQV